MPEQCAAWKNKLRTSCAGKCFLRGLLVYCLFLNDRFDPFTSPMRAAQPEELVQTAAKQAPAEANLEADDDMGESTGRRGGGGGSFLSTSGETLAS